MGFSEGGFLNQTDSLLWFKAAKMVSVINQQDNVPPKLHNVTFYHFTHNFSLIFQDYLLH